MRPRRPVARAIVAGAVGCLALAASACSATSGGSTKSGSGGTDGVSDKSVTIGVILSKTGFLQPEASGDFKAFQATIDSINADGGVEGRTVKLVTADDQSTAAGNLSAAKVLAGQKHVFAIADISGVQSGGGSYLQQQGVPVFGAGIDVAVSTYKNFFSPQGGYDPNPAHTATTFGSIFKSIGATKVGSLGLSVSQASQTAAKSGLDSAKSAGLQSGYLNTTLAVGVSDWTPYVLGFKNGGTNAFWGVIDEPNTINFLKAASQQKLSLKSFVSNLYVADLLTGPDKAAVQGVYVPAEWQPAQIKSAATDKENQILKKYGGIEQGDFRSQTGYTLGLLVQEGLTVAGKSPTRSGLQTKLRAVTNWTAGGLAPRPIDFSKEFTDPPIPTTGPGNCLWVLQVKGDTFVPVQTTPICGAKINVSK
jgi:branched-chain amino acid transport system substrate-binding protein